MSKRSRIQLSTTSTIINNNLEILLPIVANFKFRNSQLDSLDYAKKLNLSFSFEIGLNIYPDIFFILPYAKIGPEIRLLKYLYIDAHLGLGLTIAPFGVTSIPFWGTELGYILNLSPKHSF